MMQVRITVTRPSDVLARREWRFMVFDGTAPPDVVPVYLSRYECHERASTRHKWRVVALWDRGGKSRGTYSEWSNGAAWIPSPEIPQDVIDEALEAARKRVTFIPL